MNDHQEVTNALSRLRALASHIILTQGGVVEENSSVENDMIRAVSVLKQLIADQQATMQHMQEGVRIIREVAKDEMRERGGSGLILQALRTPTDERLALILDIAETICPDEEAKKKSAGTLAV